MEESTSEVSADPNELTNDNEPNSKQQNEELNMINQKLLSFIEFQACKICRDNWNEISRNFGKTLNYPMSPCISSISSHNARISELSIGSNDMINTLKYQNESNFMNNIINGSGETRLSTHERVIAESSSVIFKIDDSSVLNVSQHPKISQKSKSLCNLTDNKIKHFFCAKWKDITCLETRYSINLFNNKPDNGANFIYKNILENNIEKFVKVLKNCKFLCRKNVGEFLGDTRKQFNKDVLSLFVKTFDFTDKNIEEALRIFQSTFRLPGEAQKISHILETFSSHYLDSQSKFKPAYIFTNSDDILLLTYAIIMLNTDLHSANVKNKMTLEQFIKNIRRSEQLVDMNDKYLTNIYNKIKEREYHTSFDNISQLQQISKGINKMEVESFVSIMFRELN